MFEDQYSSAKINRDNWGRIAFNYMSCGITSIDWQSSVELGPPSPMTRFVHKYSILNNDYKIGDTVNIMSGTITKHAAQITISENTVGIILSKTELEIEDNVYEVYEILTGDVKPIVFEEFLQHTVT